MSIKSIFNPDWLRYNLRNEFGYVARPVPNSIRNFFPSLTSICPTVEIGFDQLEASKMEDFLAISDRMSCAYNSTQLTLITTDCAVKTNQFVVTFSCHMVKCFIFYTDHYVFPPFLVSPGPIYRKCKTK